MVKIKFLVLRITLAAILILTGVSGALPVEEWNKTFGGSDDDVCLSVQQTSEGGYILACYTSSYAAGDSDAWLIKTDANGNEKWNKTFGGTGDNRAYSVQQTIDGGYILAGKTGSLGTGRDAWLIKTDANGNQDWNKTFGVVFVTGDIKVIPYIEISGSVQQTTDNGYIFVGSVWSSGTMEDAWISKMDANGNEQWSKTFAEIYTNKVFSGRQTSDGGYILAGHTNSYGNGRYDETHLPDAWLIKMDASGNEQWNMTYGGKADDEIYSVKQTTDTGYILAGYTNSYTDGAYDAWLIKTDAEGKELWNKTIRGIYFDQSYSIQQTTDGGYVLAGYTTGYDVGQRAWIIKTDQKGNQQWGNTFGGKNDNRVTSVQQTSDGRYIFAGYTNSYGAGSYDGWLLKISPTPIAVASTPAPVITTPKPVLTETPTPAPSLTLTPIPTLTITPTSTQTPEKTKSAGFEVVLAITMLYMVYILRRKK